MLFIVKNIGADRLNSTPDVRDAGMQLAHGGLTHRRPQTPGNWFVYIACIAVLSVAEAFINFTCGLQTFCMAALPSLF